MENDYYALNFKKVLVVLSSPNMRADILDIVESFQVDVNLKFVDSYLQAAHEINENVADSYDFIILNTSHTNKKLKDFLEFVIAKEHLPTNFLIKYTREGQLLIA